MINDTLQTIESEILNLQTEEVKAECKKPESGYKKYAEEKKRLLESVKNF